MMGYELDRIALQAWVECRRASVGRPDQNDNPAADACAWQVVPVFLEGHPRDSVGLDGFELCCKGPKVPEVVVQADDYRPTEPNNSQDLTEYWRLEVPEGEHTDCCCVVVCPVADLETLI